MIFMPMKWKKEYTQIQILIKPIMNIIILLIIIFVMIIYSIVTSFVEQRLVFQVVNFENVSYFYHLKTELYPIFPRFSHFFPFPHFKK